MIYERLQQQASQDGIDIYEKPMKKRNKGLQVDDFIWINSYIPTNAERACILAEELGHYHTSAGDITDQHNIRNRKQERQARRWAYERLVPLSKIVQAYQDRISGRYDLAEYFGVTEEFLQEAIQRYKEKYGLYVTYEQYTIYFDPLGIVEPFE